MIGLIGKLAPLLTGLTKNEDGTPKPVSGDFNWLVRLPLLLGVVLVLVGVFAPVDEDKKAELYEIGVALLVGGPVAYGARKQMKKGDALKAPAVAAAPPPPAPAPVVAPKTDDEAAKQIENL